MRTLTGQIAVITGVSSGIGKAIALGLATQGARLGLLGRKLEKLEEVAEYARSMGQYAKSYQVDMMLEEEIMESADRLKQDFGHVDILIHSAGVISQGRLGNAPVEDFDWQYKINVRAPYVLTQALLPIVKSCQGQIVFINSSAGLNARANVGQYAATKHALKAIADSFREEVNEDGLRILSVFLGRTATPMQAAVHKIEGREYYPDYLMQPEDVASVVINALSLPRSAEVTDISMRPLRKC
jgi:NADP-dependent 3-hydroxy acid dehydrogenase YdfG